MPKSSGRLVLVVRASDYYLEDPGSNGSIPINATALCLTSKKLREIILVSVLVLYKHPHTHTHTALPSMIAVTSCGVSLSLKAGMYRQ